MRSTKLTFAFLMIFSSVATCETLNQKNELTLNSLGFLEMQGLNITVFADSFPEGHQGGVTIIQHGQRVAANGDLRLEPTPGPWSAVPKMGVHTSDIASKSITQSLTYPDPSRNGKGFNPIDYPDINFSYKINVRATGKSSFVISVDLSHPIPEEWLDRIGFNLEFYPKNLIGKAYLADNDVGHFPHQANLNSHQPLAQGNSIMIAPEQESQRILIQSSTNPLSLWDGRSQHPDGWFIVRSLVKAKTTKNAIVWTITPNVITNWRSPPVLQVSQVGYSLKQSKTIVIEQDPLDTFTSDLTIFELTNSGKKAVFKSTPKPWGSFLRYQYSIFDFTYIDKPGIYIAEYLNQQSHPFKIASDIYNQNVWQPTLEYFLPIQMCHMNVKENNRIWHDICHNDDAVAPPNNHNHFHGYHSSTSPLTKFQPGQSVPNLNLGGWHSGGNTDIDLRTQIETIWFLSTMIEEFGLSHDSTTIDQLQQSVLIHKPDGVPDALQQIEHGLNNVLTAYETMGRLYHGIIAPQKQQLTQMGELSLRTDGVNTNGKNAKDDRWVFVNENSDRALEASATFAAAARVLKRYRPDLAKHALNAAKNLYIENHTQTNTVPAKTFALTELYLSTNNSLYLNSLLEMEEKIAKYSQDTAWRIARILPKINNEKFKATLAESVVSAQVKLNATLNLTPYKIPYKKSHRGITRVVEDFGINQYFLHKAWPQHVTADSVFNAINFILGVHPGPNTASFVSGVGANSMLKSFGVDRINGAYIPGGIINGTGIVQPNLPELLDSPFLKQQSEYSTENATAFMFLALAADSLSH